MYLRGMIMGLRIPVNILVLGSLNVTTHFYKLAALTNSTKVI